MKEHFSLNKLPRELSKRYKEASSKIRESVKDHDLITLKLLVEDRWTIFSMGFKLPEGTEDYMSPFVTEYLS